MGFNLLILVLYPTVIAPLFNKFEPLADESLKARVQALMARCGFAAKGLFVMDGSRRSAHANAYFTGFGAAKRVVFFDTLLNKLSPGEVEAVLAHELGHFKHRHVIKRIVAMFALSLAGFALLGWLSAQAWFYPGLGVQPELGAPNDALALLLFMLVAPVFGFFVSPLLAQLSRRHEFEADAYACAQASGADLAAALLKLHEDNAATLTPDPVYVRFYYSHPPASERLAALAPPTGLRHAHDESAEPALPGPRRRHADEPDEAIRDHLAQVSGWQLADGAIEKTFGFRELPRDHGLRERAGLDRQRRRPPPRSARSATTAAWCASTPIRSAASRSTTSSARPRSTRWWPSTPEPALDRARRARPRAGGGRPRPPLHRRDAGRRAPASATRAARRATASSATACAGRPPAATKA